MTESGSFWISYPGRHGRKERTQAGEYELFPCGLGNDSVVARLKAKDREINELKKQSDAIRKELRRVEPKDWQEVVDEKITLQPHEPL
jgi:hypothetical protein